MPREVCLHSLGFIPLDFPPRLLTIRLVESSLFKALFILIIIANTIVLTLADPVVRSNPLNTVNAESELFFLVAFSLECVLNIVAYGLWWEGRGTFLKTPWDVFDLVIVTVGWIAWGVQDLNTSIASSLRLFRLMRPLRAIRVVPAMGWIVATIVQSGRQFLAAGFLIFLLLIVFSFFSLVFFRGKLRQRCLDDVTGAVVPDLNTFCSMTPETDSGLRCPPNSSCRLVSFNPNRNVTSFDNFGGASLILFEIMSMEGWSTTMYWISDAVGVSSQIYFTLTVIIFAIIVLNVFIAILAVNVTTQRRLYNEAEEARKTANTVKEAITLKARRNHHRMTGDDEEDDLGAVAPKPPDLDQIERDLIHHKHRLDLFNKRHGINLLDGIEMRLMLSYERMRKVPGYSVVSRETYSAFAEKHKGIYIRWRRRAIPIVDHYEKIAARKRHLFPHRDALAAEQGEDPTSLSAIGDAFSHVVPLGTPRPVGLSLDGSSLEAPKRKRPVWTTATTSAATPENTITPAADISTPKGTSPTSSNVTAARTVTPLSSLSPKNIVATVQREALNRDLLGRGKSVSSRSINVFMRLDEYLSSNLGGALARLEARRAFLAVDDLGAKPEAPSWRRLAHRIVASPWFERGMITVICFNIGALAAFRFNQPAAEAEALEGVYIAFWSIFAAEMLLKMAAIGVPCYLCNPWTAFEGLIVVFGFVEFFVPKSNENVTTVFRSFRLLRVLRVLTFVQEFRNLLEVTFMTLKTILPFTLIVMAYVYVVAIMGMMLFGGKLEADPAEYDCSPAYVHYYLNHCPPWTNYDTFAWAFITSFQVLISEDWNVINYRAVAATNGGASVYFVFVALIGNSILLNIYLGILIDSFFTISDQKRMLDYRNRRVRRKQQEKEKKIAAREQEEEEDDEEEEPPGMWPHLARGGDQEVEAAAAEIEVEKAMTNVETTSNNNNNSNTSGGRATEV